jgi:hypothetical protein
MTFRLQAEPTCYRRKPIEGSGLLLANSGGALGLRMRVDKLVYLERRED